VQAPFLHALLRARPTIAAAVPYEDKFDRVTLGEAWWSNGGLWQIVDGQLYSPGVGNNPLWLKARLPPDVRVEFDVRSEGPDGDVKWEMYGDGRNHSTGYLFLFGAWRNRESAHLQARGACADAGRSPRAARGGRAPAAATDGLAGDRRGSFLPVERGGGIWKGWRRVGTGSATCHS